MICLLLAQPNLSPPVGLACAVGFDMDQTCRRHGRSNMSGRVRSALGRVVEFGLNLARTDLLMNSYHKPETKLV